MMIRIENLLKLIIAFDLILNLIIALNYKKITFKLVYRYVALLLNVILYSSHSHRFII